MQTIKLVVVGDAGIGKTDLLVNDICNLNSNIPNWNKQRAYVTKTPITADMYAATVFGIWFVCL